MDLTSLTSKKLSCCLVILTLLFSSCSSSKKKKEEISDVQAELLKLAKDAPVTRYEPTKTKISSSYIDKTTDYGLNGIEANNFYVVDLNADSYSDLVVLSRSPSQPQFYIFDVALKKFKLSTHSHLNTGAQASFLLFADFNGDKILDMLSVYFNQQTELSPVPIRLFKGEFKNLILTFETEMPFPNIATSTSSVTAVDIDLDGDLDLFVGNWLEKTKLGFIPVADKMLLNESGKFKEIFILENEHKKGPNDRYPVNARPTYSTSTCDMDENGFPDIMTTSSSGYSNKLWMNFNNIENRKLRFFKDDAINSGYGADHDGLTVPTGGGRSFFSSCADYNNDNIMDIFLGELTHAYDPESVDRSSILTGTNLAYPPSFIRTEYISDVTSTNWNQGDRRANWIDYNLDGLLDLLVDNSGFPPYSRLVLFEQDETHAFTNMSSVQGLDFVNPTGTVILDINKDGLPDILSGQNNIRNVNLPNRIYLFENNLKLNGERSVRVYFDGKKMNHQGIGSMVWMYTESPHKKLIQKRWVEYSQGGFPSQNEEGIFFGIPRGMKLRGFKVRFPLKKSEKYSKTDPVEWRFSIDEKDQNQNQLIFTLCEDGQGLIGKKSCKMPE
jgi:hypothetical protein